MQNICPPSTSVIKSGACLKEVMGNRLDPGASPGGRDYFSQNTDSGQPNKG